MSNPTCSFCGLAKRLKRKSDPTICATCYQRVRRTGTQVPTTRVLGRTLHDTLAAYTDRSGTCWLWTGALNQAGYGQVTHARSTMLAHRASYEDIVGPIPDGLHIDHLCKVRACVNPAHLEAVTPEVNSWRAHQKTLSVDECPHIPLCPTAASMGRDEARVVASHHDQGWIRLCNGVIVFDDTGELLPDRTVVSPHRCGCGPSRICEVGAAEIRPLLAVELDALVANPVPA